MNEFGYMIKIGELADQRVADEIISELLRRNIHVTKEYDASTRSYILYAKDEKTVPEAFDYYRVRLGLAAPPRPIPEEWKAIKSVPLGQITIVFIAISVFIFGSKFFIDFQLYELFFISNFEDGGLREVYSGELWRLLTPIFLHFNFMHIIFNCLWMKDLGSLIEAYKGKSFFLIIIFSSGLLSNIGQFLVKGPMFGGLSGVVYAFLGFIWMNKKFDSDATFALPKSDMMMMIGWFFLCFTGVFGPVANTAHGIGLGIGMVFGIISGSRSSGKFELNKAGLYALLGLSFGAGTLLFELFILPLITSS